MRLTLLSSTRKGLEMKFITERGGGRPPSDLTYTMPSECEVFFGGLREPSRITHQLSKFECDLEPKSGFPDATIATGSHPDSSNIHIKKLNWKKRIPPRKTRASRAQVQAFKL